ncbi:hypothetical protein [Bacillus sp. KH172YL63]|uniref:hypothetical protein n=1 Tax=Bacillus sp. KH172YL63 TaxID=2709784 RepID=UPI0013E49AAB|nr:hypothetical protein [Bacillus sp. KH172YL63]BCB03971.1 hypothetical protein KH172YL63_21040 [Bacillus sp. KH172YL63]
MLPPQSILSTWQKFDGFPMETLTKAWISRQGFSRKQRAVSQMKEHREQYGITGNCFDLAIWLLDEFKRDGIQAYPIGHHLNSSDAHVAVIALDDRGQRYLCDLGDQWLKPILIDSNADSYSEEKQSGFFPAADVMVLPDDREVTIHYHRPNGKVSKQTFHTQPIELAHLLQAAEHSQQHIKPQPLLECRVPYKSETAHWEFYNWESFLSTSEGLMKEEPCKTLEEWVTRIHERTGYDGGFLRDALGIFENWK